MVKAEPIASEGPREWEMLKYIPNRCFRPLSAWVNFHSQTRWVDWLLWASADDPTQICLFLHHEHDHWRCSMFRRHLECPLTAGRIPSPGSSRHHLIL